MSPLEYVIRGGFLMYPILLCSIAALAIFLERSFVLRRTRQENDRFLREVRTHLRPGRLDDAIETCRENNAPLARIFLAGLLRVSDGEDRTRQSIEEAGQREVAELMRRVGGLATVVGGAPLLGFLGTVVGMIQAFQQVERLSGHVDASVLAGGIWQALLTTAAGLVVAVPTFFAHNFLVSRIQAQVRLMEERSRQLMLLLTTGRDALA